MTRRLLVTGGTGTLGRVFVPRLVDAGHEVAVLSRSAGSAPRPERRVADLGSDDSGPLLAALQDVDTVVHLASDPVHATRVDVQGTDRLVEAAQRAGVSHLILLSIVGCDANPFRYYRAKTAAETVVLGGRVPATVVRATQFHDFVPQVAGMLVQGPVALVPRGLRAQLVDLRDVADRLLALVDDAPQGRAPDLAGPEVVGLDDALTRWATATGRRVPRIVHLPAAGRTLRAFAAGSNLPGAGADVGARTFEAWLAEQSA